MSFIVRVFVLVAGDEAAVVGNVFAARDALALAALIETELGTAGVLRGVGESRDGLGSLGA